MPRDATDQTSETNVVLPDLLTTTGVTIAPLRSLLESAKDCVRDLVVVDGRVSGARIEAEQTASHGLAWLATYVEALAQMQVWAEKISAEGKSNS